MPKKKKAYATINKNAKKQLKQVMKQEKKRYSRKKK